MKRFITILLVLIWASGIAQKPTPNQPLGAPLVNLEVKGGIFEDSSFWPALRDTNWTPQQEGVIVFWAAQRQFYGFRNGFWQLFGNGNFEPPITPSNTVNQYWNGFKAFVTLNTDSITQGTTNKFFTNALARAAISLTTSGSSGAATYNLSTGVLNIPVYSGGGGSGSIDSVGLSMPGTFIVSNSPLTGTGGTIHVTFATEAPNSFFAGPTSGGAATPTFRNITTGDLPVGIPNANLANSNFNLAIGSTGTSPNWSLSTVNLGGTEILNLPIASLANTGILSNSDWSTFNSKVTTINGQTGNAVVGNADSIKHLKVDTTTDRNNYVLTFDSVNHKWFLSAGGGSSSGVSSIGALDGNGASSNGASISGSSLYMQSASTSNPGLMNNTTQSFSGNKTFIGSLTLTGITNKIVGGTDSALVRDAAGKVWVTPIGPGGIGAPNSNLGAGYRDAFPGTNNLRTFFGGYGILWDSTSNTNGLTATVDTTKIIPYTDTLKPGGIASETWVGNNFVSLTGSYANPSWITSLAWSKITGAPAFITLTSLSASSPILYNNLTGVISMASSGVGAGSCTNCNLTYDIYGRLLVATSGSGGSGNPNIQFKSSGANLNASGATTIFNTIDGISGAASGGNTVTYSLTNDSTITSGNWYYGFSNGRYGWLNSNDTVFSANGLSTLGTKKDSIGLGGRLYQNTIISGANSFGLTYDSFPAASGRGFRVNFGGDAGYDMFYRDSATGYWTRLAKGTPGQVLGMPLSGGIGWVNQTGGGSSGLTTQRVTSGSSGTVTGSNYQYVIDPASTLSTYTATLPASPVDGQVVVFLFGGTVPSGTVVTSMSVVPNSGQHIIDNTPITNVSVTADNSAEYRWVAANSDWYRFKP